MSEAAKPTAWRVSSSPHILSSRTTQRIMLDVIIALIPTGIAGVWFFGARAALIVALSVISAVVWEALIQRLMKKPVTVSDLSAVVTGLLLAYNLPADVPAWMPVVGSFVAIILVKQIFGGIGRNFVNPALASRAVMLASWAGLMSGSVFAAAADTSAATSAATSSATADAVSFATPLGAASADTYSIWQLFIGDVPGCIGEVSKLAILIGGAYLLIRRVIDWKIPLSIILTVFVASLISTGSVIGEVRSPIYQLLSGGLLLCAFFMATDYATSPITPVGKLIFGVGCGLLIYLIRFYSSSYPEGCTYAVLLMNLATPLIDRFTRPAVYGRVKKNA